MKTGGFVVRSIWIPALLTLAGCGSAVPGRPAGGASVAATAPCPVVSLPADEHAESSQPAVVPIGRFEDAAPTLSSLREKHGASRVLVVFDLDNTLLTARQDLGSDAWYTWQEALLAGAARNGSGCLEAKDLDALVETQGLLYVLGRMRPTQPSAEGAPGTVGFVTSLQKAGFRTIVLTSRGPSFNDVTRRELRRNGLCFGASAVGPEGGFAGEIDIVPRDESVLASHLPPGKPRLVAKLLKDARPARYEDGVFLSAGQHKGGMLRLLLWKAGAESAFDAIVFFDDTQKHTERMRDAFDRSPIDLRVFHYVNPSVLSPARLVADPARQRAVDSTWRELASRLREVYGSDPHDARPDLCGAPSR